MIRGAPPVAWVFALAALLPFGERWGTWDTWPSFAVYASHNERVEIYIHQDDAQALPASVRRHLLDAGGGPWLRLDLSGWSRRERGVPIYPQARVGVGVAEGLATRYRSLHPIRVVVLGRAGRFDGRRASETLVGRESLRRAAGRYRVNAHPESGGDPSSRWGFGMDRAN